MRLVFTLFLYFLSTLIFAQESWQLPSLGNDRLTIKKQKSIDNLKTTIQANIYNTLPLIHDPLLNTWLQSSINELISISSLNKKNSTIFLIKDKRLNAFVTPGNMIGVHAGLFLHAKDLHEFQAVIAHEIAHLSQQHHSRQAEANEKLLLSKTLSTIAGIALLSKNNIDAGIAALTISQGETIAKQFSNSRLLELEADLIGLSLLNRSGYDPNGMLRVFQTMHNNNIFNKVSFPFLLTHPLTDERINQMISHQPETTYTQKKTETDFELYQLIRLRILIKHLDQKHIHQKFSQPSLTNNYIKLLYAIKNHKNSLKFRENNSILNKIKSNTLNSEHQLILSQTLAEYYIHNNLFDEATLIINNYLEWLPNHTHFLYLRSTIYEKKLQFSLAIQDIQRILVKDNKNLFFLQKASILFEKNNQLASAFFTKALFNEILGNYSQAHRYLSQALTYSPQTSLKEKINTKLKRIQKKIKN